VAVLVSAESRWAMEFVGPLQGAVKAWMGDPQSYERLLAAFYRGLFDAGLSVDVVAPDQLPDDAAAMAARWPVLVVPGLYVASDALLERLRRYAEVGGHLVLTRAPATPTRTPSRATWSCPAPCARPPGSPRATRPGDDLACATHLVHCYA
jgi:beta-galactosidase GanA